jgi:hypothetical protein
MIVETGLNTARPLNRISAEEWTGKVRDNLAEARILFASSKGFPHLRDGGSEAPSINSF